VTSLRSGSSCIYLLVILSILGCTLVPYGESQVTFLTPPTYPGVGAIFVADFNGDGKPDILAADGTLNLGSGNGTFTTGTPVTGTPLAVGDFNGDGIPDVLEQGTDTLLVLLGNGNGTFQPAISTTSNANLSPVVAGDVNGDGKADLLGLFNNNLVVYLSNGDGTFAAGVSYPVGNTSIGGEAITLGDFNGDGKVDVAVSLAGDNTAGQEVVFLGNGNGRFQAGKTSTGVYFPESVVAGDFNGDGNLDLVISDGQACTSCPPTATYILPGNGDGTFQAPATIFSSSGTLVAGDVNGDGKIDLVLLGSVVQIYLGNGEGTFSNTHNYLPAPSYPAPSYGGTGLALADFNGDGNLDVATLNNVLLGNGNGSFQGWAAWALPNESPAAVAGIFVKDGKPGVAALSNSYSDTTLYILTNDGTGALTLAHTYDLQQLGGAIGTADVNGDGNLDLVVQGSDFTTQNWSYIVLLGNGDGSFQPPVVYPQSIRGGGSGFLIADFNGDGKPDLAFPTGNDTVAVLLGNGNGTFAAPAYYYVGGEGPVVTADFNDDGKLDIASGGASLALLLGNGNGTFQPATFPAANVSPGSLLTAILTGSGNPDLVSRNSVDLGNGNGTFTALTGALPSGMYATDLADINGDGKPDAIGSISSLDHGQSLGVALGNGDGTFGSYITVIQDQPNSGPGFLAVADMNGDGKQDLVGENGNVIFVLLNTTVPVAGTSFSPVSLTFPSQTVGSSSAATAVALTNSGAVVLTVTGITLGGADAGEFSQTNNCTTVQPLATCTINVTFTPTAAGTATANLIVSDSAGSGSQVVVVSGTGASTSDFTLGMPSGGSSSSTITAGGSATFGLLLTPTGSFSGVVSLACAIAPTASPAPICSVPGSVSVGSSPTPVIVTVTTTAASSAESEPFGDWPASGRFVGWILVLGASCLLFVNRRRRVVCAATIVMAFLVMAGCGGGSSTSTSTSATKGTPAGRYTVTVTASSGSLSHQAALTVIVQ
jgi:FG-GAP-like repeat/Abnormal spindle-like microcephaly-assoc'd, ASPM-SPD-2-Hydin/FG-GAP repeat